MVTVVWTVQFEIGYLKIHCCIYLYVRGSSIVLFMFSEFQLLL
jgi:hypothetical protein